MGSTAGSNITCKIKVNDVQKELIVNKDTGHTAIDNYHDNDATTFTAKSYLKKGDKVTVSISVESNINDSTANIRIYN